MRIVIDLQGAQTESRFRGIGRYSLSLVKAIIRNRGEHEIIIVLSGLFPDTIEPIRAEFDTLLPQANIRVWSAPALVCEEAPANTWRREVAEHIREAFIASLQPDVVHITSLFEGYVDDAVTSIGVFDQTVPVSVSLFDLIPLINPENYLKPNPAYEQYYLRKIDHLRRSSLMLAISESSRQEGIETLELHPASIVNVSTAVDSCFHQLKISQSQEHILRGEFGLTRPFLLYTGGADERKNLPRLIRAYAQIPVKLRDAHQLVLAGKMPVGNITQLQKSAKSAGLRTDELVITGYITDDELVKLYNLCKLYVFPSWHEGFGLPALEAMSCGAAVIGSNTSSLPEVIGNKDALFDPMSEESISGKIASVLNNEVLQQALRVHGLKQAEKFSWDKSAKVAISAFEELYIKRSDQHVTSPITCDLVNKIGGFVPFDLPELSLIKLADIIGRNHSSSDSKRLFIDISELVQRDARTGIQRVVRSILNELLENPPNGLQVKPVYASIDQGYRYASCFTLEFLNRPVDGIVDEPMEFCAGDIFLGLDLQSHVVLDNRAFFQQMRRYGVQVQFVVYDLLCILMPQYFPKEAEETHRKWLEVVTESDGAICISKSVADELDGWVKKHVSKRFRPFNISWFHLGADVDNSIPSRGIPDDADTVLNIVRGASSFLMVGTIEPRKGHAQTLAAFEQIWANGVDANLVIVGKQGWMVEKLIEKLRNHSELGKRLIWLEGISDEYLEKVYAASTCLIVASEGEGFGLPLIEAAQHLKPIIVRDIPVFREVAGEHALYFSGKKAEDLSSAIAHWLSLNSDGNVPLSDDLPWLTWGQSTQQLINHIIPEPQ